MPLSYLTKEQEDRIRDIMKVKISDLWEQAFYANNVGGKRRRRLQGSFSPDNYLRMSNNEQKKVKKAGIELIGTDLFEKYITGGFFTQEQQSVIDNLSVQFITSNEEVEDTPEFQIKDFAEIYGMPHTLILAREQDQLTMLASTMLPKYWA